VVRATTFINHLAIADHAVGYGDFYIIIGEYARAAYAYMR